MTRTGRRPCLQTFLAVAGRPTLGVGVESGVELVVGTDSGMVSEVDDDVLLGGAIDDTVELNTTDV